MKILLRSFLQDETKSAQRSDRRNCCNYFPLKPMIWMVIFRLAPDGFIPCSAQNSRDDLNLSPPSLIDWNVERFFRFFYFRKSHKSCSCHTCERKIASLNHSTAIIAIMAFGTKFTFTLGNFVTITRNDYPFKFLYLHFMSSKRQGKLPSNDSNFAFCVARWLNMARLEIARTHSF